jgi:uncharacterized protein with NAD-binding domain and iron-sulfur cluster
VTGNVYVLAVPAPALASLIPGDTPGRDFFRPARSTETAPIVGVHIWYDREVMTDGFVAVLDSPLQWVFNVTALHASDNPAELTPAASEPDLATGGGQHIVISLSGAWQWRDMGKAELRETFIAEMARTFTAARDAQVTRFLTVKMLDATFRSAPGLNASRLPQKTPVPDLFLAGDWTDTGWPSTMESAVRSGNLAAAHAADHIRSRP